MLRRAFCACACLLVVAAAACGQDDAGMKEKAERWGKKLIACKGNENSDAGFGACLGKLLETGHENARPWLIKALDAWADKITDKKALPRTAVRRLSEYMMVFRATPKIVDVVDAKRHVPALMRCLELQADGTTIFNDPELILTVIESFGPRAKEAVPLLRRIADDPEDEKLVDTISRVIRKIEGR